METNLKKNANITLLVQINDVNIQRIKRILEIESRINVFSSEPDNLFYAKSLDRSKYSHDIYKDIIKEKCFDDRVKGRSCNETCKKCPKLPTFVTR